MRVILNGKPLNQEPAGANLVEILRDLQERWLGPDHQLREVLINGRPYSEERDGGPVDITRESIQELEVLSISASEVAIHFLGNAQGFLSTMIQSTTKVAELFRVSDEQEANEQYLELLNSLQLFLQTLDQSRQALDLDFGQAREQGVSAAQRVERLSTLVEDLLQAQEQEDWVLLADVLEYDLRPELEAWDRLLSPLRDLATS